MSENVQQPTKVGISVVCIWCDLRKRPRGRSAPLMLANSLCDHECPGYYAEPFPGDLWPGETDADFGYPCSDYATASISTPLASGSAAEASETYDLTQSGVVETRTCRWCADGMPEWSEHAQVWIHRRDRACENPPGRNAGSGVRSTGEDGA